MKKLLVILVLVLASLAFFQSYRGGDILDFPGVVGYFEQDGHKVLLMDDTQYIVPEGYTTMYVGKIKLTDTITETQTIHKVFISPIFQFLVPIDGNHKSYMRPAQGGMSIGTTAGTGTGCCQVYDRVTGQSYFLTNFHVSKMGVEYDATIYQPGLSEEAPSQRTILGHGDRYIDVVTNGERNYVDAALVKPTFPSNISDYVMGIGRITGVKDPLIGMKLCISGRSSGLRCGYTILATNVEIEVPYEKPWKVAILSNQIMVSSPVIPGDSGSGAYQEGTTNIVGLVFAGSDRFAFMNPIKTVFNMLNVGIPGVYP